MTDAEMVRAAAEKVMGWKKPKPHTGPDKVAPGFTMWADGKVFKHDHTGEWNPLTSDQDCWMLPCAENFPIMRFVDLLHDQAKSAGLSGLDWLFSLPPETRRRVITTTAVRAKEALLGYCIF